MRHHIIGAALAAALVHAGLSTAALATDMLVQVGPRPYYLASKMRPGPLKDALQQCADDKVKTTLFPIGHRGGGTLQFPEHTKESHEAGARMGAGVLECDVTSNRQLFCRHDQCDLHTTTDILVTPLAAKCTQGFSPAQFSASGELVKPASALCCTSDLTVAEFKTLKEKQDAFDPAATTPREFPGGTLICRTLRRASSACSGTPRRRPVYPPGTTIFEEGCQGQTMYAIKRGRVAVVVGGKTVDALADEEIFGEMALLEHAARTASVVTRGDQAGRDRRAAILPVRPAKSPLRAADHHLLSERLRRTDRLYTTSQGEPA